MTEETENIVLKLLREMRAEHTAQFEELRAQVGVVAQGLNSVRSELKLVREQIQEIALVVDHPHDSTRWYRTSLRLGRVQALTPPRQHHKCFCNSARFTPSGSRAITVR